MSNAAFEKEMNANLQKVINKQKNGAKIIWNEDFINKAKTLVPSLSQEMQAQNQQSSQQSLVSPAYTAGSNTKTWYTYGNDALGIHLIGLKTRIMWYWDTTKLTSISPSTTGECYAPAWSYVGLSGNSSWYTGSTKWSTWKQGKFRSSIKGIIIEERTIEMTINIFAGGSYNPTAGPY